MTITSNPLIEGARVDDTHDRSAPIRVLTLVHNHPHFHPGGAEIYALDLHRAMRASGRFDPLLLAAAPGRDFPRDSGRAFYRVQSDDPTELVWVVQDFDHFFLTARDKKSYTRHLRSMLEEFDPQVVHVQHTLGLGLEALSEIRRTCPGVPILYTLHEFIPICFSRGIMLRRGTDERCSEASPWRCHQCFPERSPEDFFLREKFVQAQLRLVDLFLAPSRALMNRYVEWGIPAEKIRFHEYGRRVPGKPLDTGPPAVDTARFVFLGQTMRHKGVLVLLRAMQILARRGRDDISLSLCGTNMEFDGDCYVRQVRRLLGKLEARVDLRGGYVPEEIPSLLKGAGWVVVPSIWWENSPLVIQEAFMNGRPVICSDIGGMAEKVRHEIDGLHFRAGDPTALADTLERAAGNQELWERLSRAIPTIFSLDDALAELESIYRSLMGSGIHASAS
jgi:glycosyltransferase involved in cell wall biosynthesis